MKNFFWLFALLPLTIYSIQNRAPRPNDEEVKPNLGSNNPYFWDLFILNQLNSKKIIAEEELTIPTKTFTPTENLMAGQIILLHGTPYYYDTLRKSWLSMEHHTIIASRNGSQTDTYLALPDNLLMNENSIRIPYDSTITGASIQGQQGKTWRVASIGGDFPDLASAIASPLVTSETDIIAIAEETFTVPSTITINKSLIIYGEGPDTILQTAATGADPVNVISITADNVTLKNLTVKQRKTTNSSNETAIVISGTEKTVLDSLIIETMEFGIQVSGRSFTIKNCEFHYQGPLSNNHRFIRVGPQAGTSIIKNNRIFPSLDSGTGRTVFCYVNNPSLTGNLVFESNVQQGTGTLKQFFLQDSMSGSLSLYFINNTYQDTSGGIIFYGGNNMLNSLTKVIIANNHISNSSGKGLVTLDGFGGPGLSLGTTNWYIANNIIDSSTLVPPFSNATLNPGEIAYASNIFTLTTPIIPTTTIPATPEQLPKFSLEIRAKDHVTPLATVPVYEFGNQSTNLNGLLSQGDIIQLYLNGSAVSPVACLFLQKTSSITT